VATQVRHPIWIEAAAGRPGAKTFATLYGVESLTRASVASVVPIQAYDLLQNARSVAVLYTLVAVASLSATLLMPLLIRRFARRWVYTGGAMLLALGAASFATHTLAGQVGGMLARVVGTSALSITLNLYIMDHIRRTDFVRSESVKMAWSTLAWTLGPTLGVVLYTRFGIAASQGVTACFAFVLLGFFWFFRLSEGSVIRPGRTKAANPIRSIGRFVRQPRLRLAWLIAFGRSCFWATFFVYAPILMVATGEGKLAGGLLVSAGNAMLFMAIVWGGVAAAKGARLTMAGAFFGMSLGLFGAGFAGEALPYATAAFLLGTAFFTTALDAVGSVAFMRAVRVHERAEMTAVYRTYLDLSELLPPLVYAVVLTYFGLGSVFAALGLFTLFCGAVCWRYLPRSL
jgi:MFS family permease